MPPVRLLPVVLASLLVPFGGVHAQQWPAKPIRFIMPFVPGGGTDLVGRTMAPRLSEGLGQQVVVENRGGAGGNIGVELAAKSEPDGYTMVLGTIGNIAVNPSLYGKLPVDPIRDLAPVSQTSVVMNFLVVHPSLPVKSVQDLLALARKNPGKLTFGSSGMGAADHLAGELMNRMAGIQMIHIPYKGGGPAMVDLMSGQIQLMFATYVVARPHAEAGRLRILGVITPERQALLPGLPSVGEAVPGFGLNNWNGIFVPAKTPQPAVDRLFAEINRALGDPDLKKRQNASGIEPVGSPSQQHFVAFVQSEHERWGRIIRESGIRVE